jgi:hypothetical protein
VVVLPARCSAIFLGIDSNDEEMVTTLLEEEVDVVAIAAADEHMKIISCLLGMYARGLKLRHGGSTIGRHKTKLRQRLEGYCMLYVDYFADEPLHDDVVF